MIMYPKYFRDGSGGNVGNVRMKMYCRKKGPTVIDDTTRNLNKHYNKSGEAWVLLHKRTATANHEW